jgi:hypothetical protein
MSLNAVIINVPAKDTTKSLLYPNGIRAVEKIKIH